MRMNTTWSPCQGTGRMPERRGRDTEIDASLRGATLARAPTCRALPQTCAHPVPATPATDERHEFPALPGATQDLPPKTGAHRPRYTWPLAALALHCHGLHMR